jgi:ABC-type antimicrobial peptide transport system permease subunit
LFPTWDPQWGPLYVINLDHLYESIGTELPASLWVQVKPTADPEEVRDALYRLNPFSGIQQPFYGGLAAQQGSLERKGLLGILSTGFVSAALLATVGFFLYTLFSFRQRSIELGTLQSIGLSFWQMARYLAWELVFLVLIGLVGGTALGVAISRLWIPYFRVGSKAFADVLPMSVHFSWPAVGGMYALFGLLLVVVLAMSVVVSRRLRIYEDIKTAETT